MLLGTGVQVHASLLKHNLGTGTNEGRDPSAERHLRGRAQEGANGSRPREELFPRGQGLGEPFSKGMGLRVVKPVYQPDVRILGDGRREGRRGRELSYKRGGAHKSISADQGAGPKDMGLH